MRFFFHMMFAMAHGVSDVSTHDSFDPRANTSVLHSSEPWPFYRFVL